MTPELRDLQQAITSLTDLGGLIRAAREAAGMTRDTMAALVGVSRMTVWRWETGNAAPDCDALRRVVAALSGEKICNSSGRDAERVL